MTKKLSPWTSTLMGQISHFKFKYNKMNAEDLGLDFTTIKNALANIFNMEGMVVLFGDYQALMGQERGGVMIHSTITIDRVCEVSDLSNLLGEWGDFVQMATKTNLPVWFNSNDAGSYDRSYFGIDIMSLLRKNEGLSLWTKSLIGGTRIFLRLSTRARPYREKVLADVRKFISGFGQIIKEADDYHKIIFWIDGFITIDEIFITLPELMGQMNDQPYAEIEFGILEDDDEIQEIVNCRWDIKHGITI